MAEILEPVTSVQVAGYLLGLGQFRSQVDWTRAAGA
jgi:hypothetical protein